MCPSQAHTTSKCPHSCNLDTLIRVQNQKVHNRPSVSTNNRPNGRSPMHPRGQHPFRNHHFSSPNRAQEKHRAPSPGMSDNCQYSSQGNGLPPGLHPDVRQEPYNCPAGQTSKSTGIDEPRMGSSPRTDHPMQRDAISQDVLDVP